MNKKIVFYNNFNKGDLHLSRTMVRRFIQAFPNIEFEYIHKHGPYILRDVPVKYPGWRIIAKTHGDILYLNTWYGAYNQTIQNAYAITFDTLYHVFDKHLSHLGSSWAAIEPDPKKLFPSIDWAPFHRAGVDKAVKETFSKYRKNVLVSNGNALSGQSNIHRFNAIVTTLSNRFKDVQFICTERGIDLPNNENIAYTDSITGINGCDLNEIGYLSTFCDVIVGRSSGPYTYSMIKENMFNPNKTMLSFSSIGDSVYWLGPMANQIKYDAYIRNYNITDIGVIASKVEEVIRR